MKPLAAFTFLFAAYALVGTLDYHHLVAEAKDRAKDVQTYGRPARIWSKRCEKQGKDVLAVQADGGKWEIRCIPRRVLMVGA